MVTAAPVAAQLEQTLYVRATPAKLWDAITNGEHTARYYFGSPVESTWQPGAPVSYLSGDRSAVLVGGTVLSSEPERSLTLSLQLLYDPACAAEPAFEQTWRIEEAGNGVSRLTVSQSGIDPQSATYEQIAGGMPLILSSLKSLVETGEALHMS